MNDKAKQAEKILATKHTPIAFAPPPPGDYLSTGLTLMNLGLYGKTFGGIVKGKIYRLSGRKSTAKTFVCRQILAEAVRNDNFKDYELVYDDVEHGALMDTLKFFGQALVDRLIPPARSKSKAPMYSKSTVDFFTRLLRRIDPPANKGKPKPVIWITDSLDALDSDNLTKMTDNKAKAYSQYFRQILEPLEATKSILIVVSQARMNLGNPYGGDITAGGMALEHYPSVNIWLKKVKTLRKVLNGTKYSIGSIISAYLEKNRLTGQDCTIYFPFHPTVGIDNVGANVDFLVRSKRWVKEGKDDDEDEGKSPNIIAGDFNMEGDRETIIRKIEKDGLVKELNILVGKVWTEIREAIAVVRQPRYS